MPRGGPPRRRAFWLESGVPLLLTGQALLPAESVEIFVWATDRPAEASARSTLDAAGRFELSITLLDSVRGPLWHSIALRDLRGSGRGERRSGRSRARRRDDVS